MVDVQMADIKISTFLDEINQLLSLIINTFYSNKVIFLQELINKSSDALVKIRFESLLNKSRLDALPKLLIKIALDKVDKTLYSNGMTKTNWVSN